MAKRQRKAQARLHARIKACLATWADRTGGKSNSQLNYRKPGSMKK